MANQNVKMTYVKALEAAIACESLPDEVREKLSALKEQQEKRNSAEKKPTAKQAENEGLKELILEVIANAGKAVTISELQTMNERLNPTVISNQRVASLVRLMVEDDKLVRFVEKRKAYFKIAD